ncbi:hypothetical protein BGZ83_004791 [Gryganskiella cystojenkinii]|nr:hypothetical protein BGZ83_004791 [Gryganskiella cystojenkinii]
MKPSSPTVLKVILLVPFVFFVADFELTWLRTEGTRAIYRYFNHRDYLFVGLLVLPALATHLITIWGHYFRADALFQKSIVEVVSNNEDNKSLNLKSRRGGFKDVMKKKSLSVWERHDPWRGYTVKVWVLIGFAIVLNLFWFIQPLIAYLPNGIRFLGKFGAITAYLAFSSGYAAMGCCAMLLLFVLRRSMFQAMGYTYADLLPLHRGLGLAFVAWSTVHTICYILYYCHFNAFWKHFNFDGTTRGPQNMIALVAYAALVLLGITALPSVRRRSFTFFLQVHRILTVITFVGTLMHFPYYMLWYYVLPSTCLYLADRFVPKLIQTWSLSSEIACSFQEEADILTIVLQSHDRKQPLKPYYPGDYVNVEIPQLSNRLGLATIYHPFTIASYWPEDPYSITIYVRTFQENPSSWTGALAKLCLNEYRKEEKLAVSLRTSTKREPVWIQANVDGIFGDREHDYLWSKTLVIFSAGAAITTFMSLLKAIAAQIETSGPTKSSDTIQVHLICTFRYESELYAYGDFLERITHDPRFLSWLKTRIYVSRPDKDTPPSACPTGQCASEFVCGGESQAKTTKDTNVSEIEVEIEDAKESTSLLGDRRRGKVPPQEPFYGSVAETKAKKSSCCGDKSLCCQGSSRCNPSTEETVASSSSSSQTVTEGISAAYDTYEEDRDYYSSLPTFLAASSATASTTYAKMDLLATFTILVLPMISFLYLRTVAIEGEYKGQMNWCRTTREKDQHMTNHCLWAYSLIPGFVHILVAAVMGYFALWVAKRRANHKFPWSAPSSAGLSSVQEEGGATTPLLSNAATRDASYQKLIQGLGLTSSLPFSPSSSSSLSHPCCTPNSASPSTPTLGKHKRKILFERGRLQVNQHIQELQALGVGMETASQAVREEDEEESLVNTTRTTNSKNSVVVFGAGPDAFVDMIQESCKKTKWDVEFHRETWAP